MDRVSNLGGSFFITSRMCFGWVMYCWRVSYYYFMSVFDGLCILDDSFPIASYICFYMG